jgi:hypothetical protein
MLNYFSFNQVEHIIATDHEICNTKFIVNNIHINSLRVDKKRSRKISLKNKKRG